MVETLYFLLFLLGNAVPLISGADQIECGFPGSPAFGFFQPVKERYDVGEGVGYDCTSGWLLGDYPRICGSDGRWNGSVPVCVSAAKIAKSVRVESGNWNTTTASNFMEQSHRILDGNEVTCTSKFVRQGLRVWIDFTNPATLSGVKFTFGTRDYRKFHVFTEHSIGEHSHGKCLGTIRNTIALTNDSFRTSLQHDCDSGQAAKGIIVEFDGKENEYVRLCEVTFFPVPNDSECGMPDTPSQGHLTKEGHSPHVTYSYSCDSATKLVGPNETTCQPNRTWSNESPVCMQDFSHELNVFSKLTSPRPSETYENLFQNLSMDQNEATCAVSEWGKFASFNYSLGDTVQVKKVTLIMIDQQEFKMSVTVANSSGIGEQCNARVEKQIPFFNRREVIAECKDGTYGNVIIVQDQRDSSEFFSICKITISGVASERSTAASVDSSDQLSVNHLYLGLGCLAVVIVVIVIVVVLVKKRKRRRDSETASYYAWSNRAHDGSEETIVSGHHEVPNSRRVPLPLPRDALRHLQAGRNDSNRNHYSVITGQSDYLTVLPDPNYKESFDPHLYEECAVGRTGESLYADCTTVPQPPNTRFSLLETFLRYPGQRLPPTPKNGPPNQ